jgi:D-beta-D-heptose 7-phosphate kinase/D-beta-D-heptose 1-phosphate adenosyltransferase
MSALKGPERPLVPEQERAEVLGALACVDYVTIFDAPDPGEVIAAIQPDVLVKGGDWPIEKIVGREVVQARGGRVVSIPLVPGASTTGLIRRILDRTIAKPTRT